jgi:hypothetical protein
MKYPNILICGSTRSGKSMAELRRLVDAAEAGAALVVIDPHRDSLASRLLEHLVARGLKARILFDRLTDLDRVLGYDFLPKPTAATPLQRLTEVDELVRSFCNVLCRRRQLESLATAAQTEEWVIPALLLYLEQEDHPPLPILDHAFGPPGHPDFMQLLRGCRNQEVASKFREIERGAIRRGQYAPAERLIHGVCNSPAFAIRCGATFHLASFLGRRGILLIEGGGSVSDDAMRTMMGAVILQVIRHVRSRPRPSPPVILALDEATNAGLIGASGYETRAAAECQKMGLAIHILVQSLNFPSAEITEGLLTNCIRHEWFFAANQAVIRKAAGDLGGTQYEGELRSLKVGERFVKDRDRVSREYVPLLEDPWGFGGLARKKAQRALEEIKRRPEYRTPWVASGRFVEDTATAHQTPVDRPSPPTEGDNPNVGI